MTFSNSFSMSTAGRPLAPQTRRATFDCATKARPGVSLRIFPAAMARQLHRTWTRRLLRREERAALIRLRSASPHLLDDIGISRADLDDMIDRLD